MKILIAYDGSQCSEASLDDLARAGLPKSCEAAVITIAEVWLPPASVDGNVAGIKLDEASEGLIQRHYERNKRIVAEAETLANHAKSRLQGMFPLWRITAQGTWGSPAWAILERSDEFKADLIVVGSHGRSAISRFFLGSISQKVLTEAHCSVRVARRRVEVDTTPVRIVIGFDGSQGAQAAVEAVASRSWSEHGEVRLIAVTDEVTPTAIGRFVPPDTHAVDKFDDCEREWIEKLADSALIKLDSKNFSATLHLHPGNPKDVLVEEAARWSADCLFVGANAVDSCLGRFLLGSTSAAVAARAHCTVEVVRRNAGTKNRAEPPEGVSKRQPASAFVID